MQYRQFSNPTDATWFPLPPILAPTTHEQLATHCNQPPPIVATNTLQTEAGRLELQEFVGIPVEKADIATLFGATNKDIRNRAEALEEMMPFLRTIEESSLVAQGARLNKEADGLIMPASHNADKERSASRKKSSASSREAIVDPAGISDGAEENEDSGAEAGGGGEAQEEEERVTSGARAAEKRGTNEEEDGGTEAGDREREDQAANVGGEETAVVIATTAGGDKRGAQRASAAAGEDARPHFADAAIVIQTALLSSNSEQRGYIIMIDYVANAIKYGGPPPDIRSVVPEIINVKEIWDRNKKLAEEKLKSVTKTFDLLGDFVADSSETTDLTAFDTTTIVEQDVPDDCSLPPDHSNKNIDSSDEEHVEDEAQQRAELAHNSTTNAKKAMESKAQKSHLMHIIKAVAGIKRTACNMLDLTSRQGRYETTNFNYAKLRYDQIYERTIVTPDDLKYYEERKTPELIFSTFQREVDAEPPFEWLPKELLSREQHLRLQERIDSQAEEEKIALQMIENIRREKESATSEVIRRAIRPSVDAVDKATLPARHPCGGRGLNKCKRKYYGTFLVGRVAMHLCKGCHEVLCSQKTVKKRLPDSFPGIEVTAEETAEEASGSALCLASTSQGCAIAPSAPTHDLPSFPPNRLQACYVTGCNRASFDTISHAGEEEARIYCALHYKELRPVASRYFFLPCIITPPRLEPLSSPPRPLVSSFSSPLHACFLSLLSPPTCPPTTPRSLACFPVLP